MTKQFAVALCALTAGLSVPTYADPAPSGPGPAWASLEPVPAVGSGVEGMSVASVGNSIIAAFGFDPGLGDTATTRIYDIAHDTWLLGASAPAGSASSEGAGVAHGGLFYTVGGRAGGGPSTDILSYDPASDTWTVLTPMSTGRAGLAVAVVGDAIYAIGGRTGTGGPNSFGKLAVVERYDIDTNTWTTVAPLLSPRSDLAAAGVGGKIYVFGGFNAAGFAVSDVDVYDPVTNTWSAAPADMPTARGAMYAVATKGGTVYVIGGWDGLGTGLSTNEAYKVATNTWTIGLLPMPTARAETGAVSHGGRVYIVGGGQPGFGNSVSANEVFKP